MHIGNGMFRTIGEEASVSNDIKVILGWEERFTHSLEDLKVLANRKRHGISNLVFV